MLSAEVLSMRLVPMQNGNGRIRNSRKGAPRVGRSGTRRRHVGKDGSETSPLVDEFEQECVNLPFHRLYKKPDNVMQLYGIKYGTRLKMPIAYMYTTYAVLKHDQA